MTHNVIFESELAKIWNDEFAPLVFIKLKKIPATEKQLDTIRKGEVEAIKQQFRKHHVAYTINDASEVGIEKKDDLLSFLTRSLSDQQRAGLTYAAYLQPVTANGSPVEEISVRKTGTDTGIFGTFEQAMTQVNSLWSHHIRRQRAIL